MKRILPILLILCVLLCACGKAPEETTPSTEPTTEATTEPTTEATTVPTEPPVLYRHPLTGEPLEQPWTVRPIAVVVPNNKAAYPQHGLTNADMVYEIEAEGGITRCLFFFTRLDGVEKIGPVRSARTFFNNVAISYDTPIVHCGGSPGGRTGRYDSAGGDTIANWPHVDEFANGGYFYRDRTRYNNGYAWEYTLFTTGESLSKVMTDKGYYQENNGLSYGLTFDDESSATTGTAANVVNVVFRNDKVTTFNYNADTGRYSALQHNETWIDGTNNEAATFRNILILNAEQWFESSRTYYDLIGSGTGMFACDGKVVPITWERPSLRDNFSYKLADGTPLTLGVGTSYVAITNTLVDCSYS